MRFLPLAVLLAVATFGFAVGAFAQDFDELENHATEAFELRRFEEAATFAERALAQADSENIGETDPRRLDVLGVLAGSEQWFGNLEAEETHLRAILAIMEANFGGPGNINTAFALEALALNRARAGDADTAEAMLDEAVALRRPFIVDGEDAFATVHRAVRARIALTREDWPAAYDGFAAVVNDVAAAGAVPQRDRRGFVFATDSWTFLGLAQAAWELTGGVQGSTTEPVDTAFRAMQWKWRTSAASALLRAAARPYAEDEERTAAQRDLEEKQAELAELTDRYANFPLTRQQTPEQQAIEAELEKALARQDTGAQVNIVQRSLELTQRLVDLMEECPLDCASQMEAIQAEMAALEADRQAQGADIAELQRRLQEVSDPEEEAAFNAEWNRLGAEMRQKQAEFDRMKQQFDARYGQARSAPQNTDFLLEPDPIPIAEVQSLLGPDDALLAYLVADEMSFVWAISRDDVAWAPVPVPAHELLSRVSRLVHGFDPNGSLRGARPLAAAAAGTGFSVAEAYELFRLLVAPVDDVVEPKGHVYLVPTGPLTALPFHALVTKPPDPALSGADALRDAAWLARRQATTVLPSVVSLRALREFTDPGRAPKAFIGFGDPDLGGTDDDGRRDISTFFEGSHVDVARLRRLAALPETADELAAVARALGGDAELFLGERASEAAVRQAAMADYRVVHFATHGLVAGELRGLAEPAIVLTPPDRATPANDGLLTASEIAGIKMNADWVVLSACNTASASAAGAEAFSGLARAFFHAGARALLVSYWPVDSGAAVKLTTGAFEASANDPGIGKAEALRRSMLAVLDHGTPSQLQPRYWAPFVVMGQGASR